MKGTGRGQAITDETGGVFRCEILQSVLGGHPGLLFQSVLQTRGDRKVVSRHSAHRLGRLLSEFRQRLGTPGQGQEQQE